MKKILTLSITVIAVLCFSHYSFAQTTFQAGIKLGYSNPMQDFGDDFDGGFVYGLYGEVSYNDYFSIEGALQRHKHKEGPDGLGELFTLEALVGMFPGDDIEDLKGEAETTINELTLNGRFYFTTREKQFRPYVSAGLGAYFWTLDIDRIGDHTDIDFGINAGGGISFRIADQFSFGIEALYHYIWILLASNDEGMEYVNFSATGTYHF